eukprot:tig00000980_g6150.t1
MDPRGCATRVEAEAVLHDLAGLFEALHHAKIVEPRVLEVLQRIQQSVLQLLREREELASKVATLAPRGREGTESRREVELLARVVELEEECTQQRAALEARLGALLQRESALRVELDHLEAHAAASPSARWPGDDPLGVRGDGAPAARDAENARLRARVAALESQLSDALGVPPAPPGPTAASASAPRSHGARQASLAPPHALAVLRAHSAPATPILAGLPPPGGIADQALGSGRLPLWAAPGATAVAGAGRASERGGEAAARRQSLSSSRSVASSGTSPRPQHASAPGSPGSIGDIYRAVWAQRRAAARGAPLSRAPSLDAAEGDAAGAAAAASEFMEIRGALRKRWQRK